MNFKTFKVNCSSIQAFLSNPKDNKPVTDSDIKEFVRIVNKESIKITPLQVENLKKTINRTIAYDEDKLSETAKTELAKIYAFENYNCGTITYGGNWIPTEKGIAAEPTAVDLLSELDGVKYQKNEKLFKNRFFKGKPDIIVKGTDRKPVSVKEIKIPTTLSDFISVLTEGPDIGDIWQMRGYLDILNLPEGEVIYCLVNMPDSIFQSEQERIRDTCRKIQAPPEEIERRLAVLYANMHYDHIPKENRVIRFTVFNDQALMKTVKNRVKLVRSWLQNLDNLFNKPLNLVENIEQLPESTD